MKDSIELLRDTVNLFNDCDESFNQRYTAEELLKIAKACFEGQWGVSPDYWQKRQIEEAIQLGKSPRWRETEDGIVPVYE